jgi:hypothetical protein
VRELPQRLGEGFSEASLAQTFSAHPVLGEAVALLRRQGIRTFGHLLSQRADALVAIGVTRLQLELLDRACALAGHRIRG